MSRTVLLSTPAQRDFDQLDVETRRRVRSGLLEFGAAGRVDVKRLKGVGRGRDLFRLRVGEFRIVFELTRTEVRVTRIMPRNACYGWL